MFTGIIETLGLVKGIQTESDNIHFEIESDISKELKIDQSVSHNGVCLTVVKSDANFHTVTAVKETLIKSNLGMIGKGNLVNLERCLAFNGRLDGHLVQGHVDQIAKCVGIKETGGSTQFDFEYDKKLFYTVEKGSVCVNGVSLTVFNSLENGFSVAIIPYTFENTNFKSLKIGESVNLEFDIIGKYVAEYMKRSY